MHSTKESRGFTALTILMVTLTSLAHAQPTQSPKKSPLDKRPAALGLHADAHWYTPAMVAHFTPEMQEKPKPGDHFKWFKKEIQGVYPGGHCYAIVAIAPPGHVINVYSGYLVVGDFDSKGGSDEGGVIVTAGSCVSRPKTRLIMLMMTTAPGDIDYRIAEAPNPNQAEMAEADAQQEKECLQSCRRQLDRCVGENSATFCRMSNDQCTDTCTGVQ
jgi:hypothetical protein